MLRNLKKLLLLVSGVILLAVSAGCGNRDTILIGTQTFSEPKILAQMYKLLIEDRTDIRVDVLPDLASSTVVFGAMARNDTQMSTLYTGLIFDNYFPIETTKDRAKVLEQAQRGFYEHYGLVWFDSYGFENTYAFTVRKDVALQNHLEKISDMRPHADAMTLGVDTTWLELRPNGYEGFKETYGFEFADVRPMEIALVYKAVASKTVDIVLAYSTDSRLKAYELQTLIDDKQFFPPYDASPVIRKEILDRHPELRDIINLLVGKIDVQTMIDLNYEVDVKKRNERRVAEDYLRKIGLLT